MANFKANEAILAKTISQPTFWPAICKERKADMYVVQIIHGETLQEPAEVSVENLRKLIPKSSAPSKNRALWCRSHKCATSMAEVPSKCQKKAQKDVPSKKRKKAEKEDEAAPGPSKRHKKAQEDEAQEEDEAAPGPSKRHKKAQEDEAQEEDEAAPGPSKRHKKAQEDEAEGENEAAPGPSKRHKNTGRPNTKDIRSKANYVILCGDKQSVGESWIQVKGKSSPFHHSVVKMSFGKEATYDEMLSALQKEFKYSPENTTSVLVDMENKEIPKTPSFTMLDYIQTYKKYVGSTRIYLGIRQDTRPTTVTNFDKSDNENETLEKYEVVDVSQSLKEDAIEYLKQNEEIELMRGRDDVENGELAELDTSLICPVYAENPRAMLFLKEAGYRYEIADSGYEKFICIPHNDMDGFDKFGKSLPLDRLFIVNAALMYFVYFVNEGGFDDVTELSKEVWELKYEISNKYRSWRDTLISNLP